MPEHSATQILSITGVLSTPKRDRAFWLHSPAFRKLDKLGSA